MQLITRREESEKIYAELADNSVAMLAPCCENSGQIESILIRAQRSAERHSINSIPISVGFTGAYPEYPTLKRTRIGGKIGVAGELEGGEATEGYDMIMGYLRAHIGLRSSDRVLVLPFLDHGQLSEDTAILEDPRRLKQLSLVTIEYLDALNHVVLGKK